MNTFFDWKVPIAKADLLRLLILYANGGYADLDVECEDPIDSRIPIH
jgi:mannosyltransferase OCH1-like enzyme